MGGGEALITTSHPSSLIPHLFCNPTTSLQRIKYGDWAAVAREGKRGHDLRR